MSIKLSKKHGVNPTIPVCFFCGNEKNEVALLGELPDDIEVPRYTMLDYEPCDTCKKHMDKGVTVVEVSPERFKDNRPPIQDNLYPTGRWAVLTKESAKKMFNTDNKFLLIDTEIMNDILQTQ